ncbi:sulfurtransferase TusA family protein [Pararhodospirillum photometricum]|uniref:UPF0033 domain-containing protein n=1 Tax=Pararhodospirillum photometricum DSM 122 TaxID=1150469 RepID=H6SMB9_PARPM|nr:sulfurtransferase TusA family protein [Pararhodospirillum photometricum]CCG06802.1 Putative uncharacterized protein [Pararhodospirillum photometricum DSM 122]
MDSAETPYTAFIDVSSEVCPMTFVKIRLRLDALDPGDVLAVRLKGDETLTNVSHSAQALGHTVLPFAPASPESLPDIHHLSIVVNSRNTRQKRSLPPFSPNTF